MPPIQVLLQTSTLLSLSHALIVVVISVRVIMQRPATGVALAWLFLVSILPFVGASLYLLVGERRVSQTRARRIAMLHTDNAKLADLVIRHGMTDVNWDKHHPEAQAMDRLGTTMAGIPTVCGSRGRLFTDTPQILRSIAADIDNAERSVLMEFYIWHAGGAADEVLEALLRAGRRGVSCRVLVDALGGRPWWRSSQPEQLRAAGVQVQPALPVGLLQTFTGRNDLRLHRKIVVIDSQVAWTGSMNLVDPRYFKQDAGVGEWVDAMVRLEGSVVALLAMTVIGDWMLETNESMQEIIDCAGLRLCKPVGNTDVQVVSSGPLQTEDALLQMLLALIHSAREELVITTPYFIPDDALLRALRGAALRGVQVDMIVPEKVDSLLTRFASRSYYDELMRSGIRLHLFGRGLLHTKSITADRRLAMFGTVNLDMRSLWLNYEVSLFVYGAEFSEALYAVQQAYLADSHHLDLAEWSDRWVGHRFIENVLRLVNPVL